MNLTHRQNTNPRIKLRKCLLSGRHKRFIFRCGNIERKKSSGKTSEHEPPCRVVVKQPRIRHKTPLIQLFSTILFFFPFYLSRVCEHLTSALTKSFHMQVEETHKKSIFRNIWIGKLQKTNVHYDKDGIELYMLVECIAHRYARNTYEWARKVTVCIRKCYVPFPLS